MDLAALTAETLDEASRVDDPKDRAHLRLALVRSDLPRSVRDELLETMLDEARAAEDQHARAYSLATVVVQVAGDVKRERVAARKAAAARPAPPSNWLGRLLNR